MGGDKLRHARGIDKQGKERLSWLGTKEGGQACLGLWVELLYFTSLLEEWPCPQPGETCKRNLGFVGIGVTCLLHKSGQGRCVQ